MTVRINFSRKYYGVAWGTILVLLELQKQVPGSASQTEGPGGTDRGEGLAVENFSREPGVRDRNSGKERQRLASRGSDRCLDPRNGN